MAIGKRIKAKTNANLNHALRLIQVRYWRA
jgi:hypothetical protein